MKNYIGVTLVCFALLAATSQAAMANESYRICVGEIANKCPVAVDSFFGCGTSYDAAAESVCTIMINGERKVSPYKIIPQGTHSGNECGYGWARVICYD